MFFITRWYRKHKSAVAVHSRTMANPVIARNLRVVEGDVHEMYRSNGTFAEALVEYAARVCYRSTSRMGTSENFIQARLREGHADVVEHPGVVLRFVNTNAPRHWRNLNRHCDVLEVEPRTWLVGANLRVWRDLMVHRTKEPLLQEALFILEDIAPSVFQDLYRQEHYRGARGWFHDKSSYNSLELLPQHVDGKGHVVLLGFTQPVLEGGAAGLNRATFLVEGVSRALTHQLVRHRLASFSQESQRYVDMAKAEWEAVIPPRIRNHGEAYNIMLQAWDDNEQHYASLRRLGMRKEDARFLLPNAAETRVMVSMDFNAWSHFCWLRAVDKAAQWEIRTIGQEILRQLHQLAPEFFHEHMVKLDASAK